MEPSPQTLEGQPSREDPRQSDIAWLLIICLYFYTALWGIVQIVVPGNTVLWLLFAVTIAYSATAWAVIDSRRAKRPLLHVVQLLMFFTWPIAVSTYLIWSRRLQGCGFVLFHAVALTITVNLFCYATYFLLYGFYAFNQ